MDITVDILLGFLREFSITLVFCALGAWIRAVTKSSKNQEKINTNEVAVSVIFSTFLMCCFMHYVHIVLEVYSVICIICGMWSKSIINAFLNEKFIRNLLSNLTKLITAPVIKEVVKTASQTMDDEFKELEENRDKNQNKNIEKSQKLLSNSIGDDKNKE